MRILLDTRCWLWMQVSPERFSPVALDLLREPGHDFLFSAASSWEIAIKYANGKLALPSPPEEYVPSRLAGSGVEPIPVEHRHTLRVAELPPHHHDIFDRLLIAQAQLDRLTLLTADRRFTDYAVDVFPA